MAGKKISQLSSSLSPSLTGYTVFDNGSTTYKTTLQTLRNVLVDGGSHNFTGSQTINGNLTVSGSIIAQSYILSASVSHVTVETISGSSNFGNSSDDRHSFTGSVNVTGPIVTTNTISGSALHVVSNFQPQLQLKNTTTGNEYHIGTGARGLLSIHDGNNNSITYFSTSSVNFEVPVNVTSSLNVTGSLNLKGVGNMKRLIVGTGSFDPINPEALHVEISGSYNIARFDAFNNSYAQLNFQNHSGHHFASTDIVATANNGDETNHYIDLGINSENYDGGYVGYGNDSYLINVGKDMYVGTVGGSGHPANLKLFAENLWEEPQMIISGSRQISFNTGSVSNGFIYEFSGSVKLDNDLVTNGFTVLTNVTSSFNNDGEAAAGGVPLQGLYRSGSFILIRLT